MLIAFYASIPFQSLSVKEAKWSHKKDHYFVLFVKLAASLTSQILEMCDIIMDSASFIANQFVYLLATPATGHTE